MGLGCQGAADAFMEGRFTFSLGVAFGFSGAVSLLSLAPEAILAQLIFSSKKNVPEVFTYSRSPWLFRSHVCGELCKEVGGRWEGSASREAGW